MDMLHSICQKTREKVHALKVKHTNKAMRTQRKSPSSATFNVQILNKSTAKITLYNMSNNNKRKPKVKTTSSTS